MVSMDYGIRRGNIDHEQVHRTTLWTTIRRTEELFGDIQHKATQTGRRGHVVKLGEPTGSR